MINRREELENFQCDLKKLDTFINATGIKASINVIDPSYEKMESLGHATESALEWISREIEVELEKENEMLPDEGNSLHEVGA